MDTRNNYKFFSGEELASMNLKYPWKNSIKFPRNFNHSKKYILIPDMSSFSIEYGRQYEAVEVV